MPLMPIAIRRALPLFLAGSVFAASLNRTLARAEPPKDSAQNSEAAAPSLPATQLAEVHTVVVIVAENVLIVNRRIRTWDELLADLTTLRKAHPQLILKCRVTRGALETGVAEDLKKKTAAIDPKLVQPADIRIGVMSPINSERFDAIQTVADLVPPKDQLHRGTVRTATGRPVKAGKVYLVRHSKSAFPPFPTPEWMEEHGPDEIWTELDPEGRFEIAAPDADYWLAIVSPLGFAFAPLPEPGKPIDVTLASAVTVRVSSKSPQRIALFIEPNGMPGGFTGFAIINEEVGEKPLTLRLPAGALRIDQIRINKDGVGRFHNYYSSSVKAGAQEHISVPPLAEGIDDE